MIGDVRSLTYCLGQITRACEHCSPDPVGNPQCSLGYKPVRIGVFDVAPTDEGGGIVDVLEKPSRSSERIE